VWGFLRSTPGLRTDGHNVMLYRNSGVECEVAVEVGVQVTATFEGAGRVVASNCRPARRRRRSTRGRSRRSGLRTTRRWRGARRGNGRRPVPVGSCTETPTRRPATSTWRSPGSWP